MPKSLFRVKRYSHPKYKFLVRSKVEGKWKRRYFLTETEAIAFAEEQNAHGADNRDAPSRANGDEERLARRRKIVGKWPRPERPEITKDLSKLVSPAYLGPRIQHYVGDSWCMHLPFAYDLMRELAPKVFVELGVKDGESYFAFCQSAAENKINVKCYGVDSWQGDIQTGPLDPKIQEAVVNYNWRYSSFSELKPMHFAEALADFPDSSIELLHIDGTHTYHDVKADFESWLPKVSPNGLVLFHDVMVRDRGFGVWKVWEEIARQDNSFLFEFGFGLGVWKKQPIAPNDPPFLQSLFRADKAEKLFINESYANAAAALALWENLARQFPPKKQGPLFAIEGEERATEIARFRRKAKIQARETEEKAQRVLHLQCELEESTSRLTQIQREFERKEREASKTSQQVAELRQEKADLRRENAALRRDRDNHAQSTALIKSQLAATEERLEQASLDVLEAQWESLTLRRDFSGQSEPHSPSARIVELEGRTAAAESERDHLRAMVSSLQKDIDSERERVQRAAAASPEAQSS